MNFKIIPNNQKEMFYSSNNDEHRCIGHVRIDFGRGKEFYHTWWPHSAHDVNTNLFSEDLCRVVDTLRKNLLKNLSEMRKFISYNSAPKIGNDSYGYYVGTEQYEYYIRCIPVPGNYNCYIYCYAKQ